MDRRAFSFLSLGLLVGAFLASLAYAYLWRNQSSGGPSDKLVLRLAHAMPPSSPSHLGMEFFAEKVAELSGGKVEVQIFPSGQLGSQVDTIEQLQRGALAMVKSSTGELEMFADEMTVFGIPYLFADEEHYWRVLNGEIGEEMLQKANDVGIHGLCYYDAGSRSFYTVNRQVRTPEDLRGMKIRVMSSPSAIAMVNQFGASPTSITFGELYTALQQGMVDGAENNPPSVYDSRHWEIAKYYTLDEHTRLPDMLIFSQPLWESLDPQTRQWIDEAAKESVVYQRKVWNDYVQECLDKMVDEGVQIYRPDKEPFKQAVQPIYEQQKGTAIGDLIERIQAVEDPQ
ncbi:MAG: hypothetical protein E1N59_2364 [Puniceicoccaceae bacterium 5H]|nr:MAG: hypothetical protein E1N59_2364 [Puniceicoccaceae bacterium 5H]